MKRNSPDPYVLYPKKLESRCFQRRSAVSTSLSTLAVNENHTSAHKNYRTRSKRKPEQLDVQPKLSGGGKLAKLEGIESKLYIQLQPPTEYTKAVCQNLT